MPKSEMKKLAIHMERKSIARKEPLASQGHRADCVFFIREGEVKVKCDFSELQNGAEQARRQLVDLEAECDTLSARMNELDSTQGREQYQLERTIRTARVEIHKISTQLRVLLQAGASLSTTSGLPVELREHCESQESQVQPLDPRMPRRKRRKSMAIVAKNDIIHECVLDSQGNEVWGADYLANSLKAEVQLRVCSDITLAGVLTSQISVLFESLDPTEHRGHKPNEVRIKANSNPHL